MKYRSIPVLAFLLLAASIFTWTLPVHGSEPPDPNLSRGPNLSSAVPAARDPIHRKFSDYYGQRLADPVSVTFYDALESMAASCFDQGTSLELKDPAVIAEARQSLQGDPALLYHFGAAVDSFRFDHMDSFCVDWDQLSLSICQNSNGAYSVKIGTGTSGTYLKADPSQIPAMKETYQSQLDAMADAIAARLGDACTVKEAAWQVYTTLCAHVSYNNGDEDPDQDRMFDTAYGALVNQKANCEGYARLYKALMEALNERIPCPLKCELVSGFWITPTESEPHMWNEVCDEQGRWFAVDPTISDSMQPETTLMDSPYFWGTETQFSNDHAKNPIISSSLYPMPYPCLMDQQETLAWVEEEPPDDPKEPPDSLAVGSIGMKRNNTDVLIPSAASWILELQPQADQKMTRTMIQGGIPPDICSASHPFDPADCSERLRENADSFLMDPNDLIEGSWVNDPSSRGSFRGGTVHPSMVRLIKPIQL